MAFEDPRFSKVAELFYQKQAVEEELQKQKAEQARLQEEQQKAQTQLQERQLAVIRAERLQRGQSATSRIFRINQQGQELQPQEIEASSKVAEQTQVVQNLEKAKADIEAQRNRILGEIQQTEKEQGQVPTTPTIEQKPSQKEIETQRLLESVQKEGKITPEERFFLEKQGYTFTETASASVPFAVGGGSEFQSEMGKPSKVIIEKVPEQKLDFLQRMQQTKIITPTPSNEFKPNQQLSDILNKYVLGTKTDITNITTEREMTPIERMEFMQQPISKDVSVTQGQVFQEFIKSRPIEQLQITKEVPKIIETRQEKEVKLTGVLGQSASFILQQEQKGRELLEQKVPFPSVLEKLNIKQQEIKQPSTIETIASSAVLALPVALTPGLPELLFGATIIKTGALIGAGELTTQQVEQSLTTPESIGTFIGFGAVGLIGEKIPEIKIPRGQALVGFKTAFRDIEEIKVKPEEKATTEIKTKIIEPSLKTLEQAQKVIGKEGAIKQEPFYRIERTTTGQLERFNIADLLQKVQQENLQPVFAPIQKGDIAIKGDIAVQPVKVEALGATKIGNQFIVSGKGGEIYQFVEIIKTIKPEKEISKELPFLRSIPEKEFGEGELRISLQEKGYTIFEVKENKSELLADIKGSKLTKEEKQLLKEKKGETLIGQLQKGLPKFEEKTISELTSFKPTRSIKRRMENLEIQKEISKAQKELGDIPEAKPTNEGLEQPKLTEEQIKVKERIVLNQESLRSAKIESQFQKFLKEIQSIQVQSEQKAKERAIFRFQTQFINPQLTESEAKQVYERKIFKESLKLPITKEERLENAIIQSKEDFKENLKQESQRLEQGKRELIKSGNLKFQKEPFKINERKTGKELEEKIENQKFANEFFKLNQRFLERDKGILTPEQEAQRERARIVKEKVEKAQTARTITDFNKFLKEENLKEIQGTKQSLLLKEPITKERQKGIFEGRITILSEKEAQTRFEKLREKKLIKEERIQKALIRKPIEKEKTIIEEEIQIPERIQAIKKPKEVQSLRTTFENEQRFVIKPKSKQEERISLGIKQPQMEKQIQKQFQRQKQEEKQGQRQVLKSLQLERTGEKEKIAEGLRFESITDQLQLIKQKTLQKTPLKERITEISKLRIPEMTKGRKQKEDQKKARKTHGYFPEVRRQRKWIKLSKPLTKSQAERLAEYVVENTAARSYRIEETDQPPQKEKVVAHQHHPFKFYKSKREKDVYIEKSKYAIATAGEKREITEQGLKAIARKGLKKKVRNILGL